jgi:hypothetical protein
MSLANVRSLELDLAAFDETWRSVSDLEVTWAKLIRKKKAAGRAKAHFVVDAFISAIVSTPSRSRIVRTGMRTPRPSG